jgi:hypothetical protein
VKRSRMEQERVENMLLQFGFSRAHRLNTDTVRNLARISR